MVRRDYVNEPPGDALVREDGGVGLPDADNTTIRN